MRMENWRPIREIRELDTKIFDIKVVDRGTTINYKLTKLYKVS